MKKKEKKGESKRREIAREAERTSGVVRGKEGGGGPWRTINFRSVATGKTHASAREDPACKNN